MGVFIQISSNEELRTHVTQMVTDKSHRDDRQLASGFNPMFKKMTGHQVP